MKRKVLVVATSKRTRGGITAVVQAHKQGKQWDDFHCKWIQTHRDGFILYKLWYLLISLLQFLFLLPFYDIVHIHIATTRSAHRKKVFLYLAKLFRKKIILHFHPSNEKFLFESSNRQLYKKLFSQADVVLVLSEQWKRWIKEALELTENIKVLYNPCPVVNRNLKYRKKQILFAGSIIQRKGYKVLLKAFAKIAENYPDWCVVFAGNGEIEEGRKMADVLGLSRQVRFIGWVTGKVKERVFQESSIYCLASDGEGFPMGVLDAWAYGIPCIVTPVGGIPDIVIHHVNGLLFPVGDYEKLSSLLDELINDEQLRMQIVKEADKYVDGLFSLEYINNKLADIYTYI